MTSANHNAAPRGFVEDMAVSPEGSYDFDWDSLFRSLGEVGADDTDKERLADALREILRWLVGDAGLKHCLNKRTEIVGRRAMMLCWVIDPGLLDGASQQALAADVGVNKVTLSKIAVEVRQRFGLVNRCQRAHDWRLRKKGGEDDSR